MYGSVCDEYICIYIYIMWACLSVPQRAKIWLMLILEDYFCFLGERKPLFSSLFVVCHQNPCSLTDKGLHSSSSPSQEANASVMSTNSSAQRPWRVGHFTTFWLRNERPPKLWRWHTTKSHNILLNQYMWIINPSTGILGGQIMFRGDTPDGRDSTNWLAMYNV